MIGWLRWGTNGVKPRPINVLADAAAQIEALVNFTSVVSEFLGDLAKLPIMQGKSITGVSVDASGSAQFFQHGMQRPYAGGFVTGHSDPSSPVFVMTPDAVVQSGQDPRLVYGLYPSSAVANTVNVWVF